MVTVDSDACENSSASGVCVNPYPIPGWPAACQEGMHVRRRGCESCHQQGAPSGSLHDAFAPPTGTKLL